jgi:hypothetical protein
VTRSAARTLIVFVGVGPLIGLVTFSLLSELWYATWDFKSFVTLVLSDPWGLILGTSVTLLSFFFEGIVPAYFVGLVPAAVSGGLVAWLSKIWSRYEPLWITSIGLLVGVAYSFCLSMIVGLSVSVAGSLDVFVLYELFVLALTCVVSTLVCWAIACPWYEPERIPA